MSNDLADLSGFVHDQPPIKKEGKKKKAIRGNLRSQPKE